MMCQTLLKDINGQNLSFGIYFVIVKALLASQKYVQDWLKKCHI